MTKQTAKVINFPEEKFSEKVKGVYLALDYISNEASQLGLKFTAHMVGAAADMAVIEMTETDAGRKEIEAAEEHVKKH